MNGCGSSSIPNDTELPRLCYLFPPLLMLQIQLTGFLTMEEITYLLEQDSKSEEEFL